MKHELLGHNVLDPWPWASKSVQTIVTSPPYWGLRDYGVVGQLGMEDTPEQYVANIVMAFDEAHRCLKDDGTLWLNLGDTYMGGKGANGASSLYMQHSNAINKKAIVQTVPGEFRPNDRPHPILKAKDMVGIPWRVAFALQARGWYLRQDIIWAKPNPMPESVIDRCGKSHEYIFLLSKSKSYYFDFESIREPSVSTHSSGNGFKRSARLTFKNADGTDRGNPNQWTDVGGVRNKRSVWTVPTEPFKEAHFAVFPPALIIDCIKAGCPVGGTVGDPFTGSGTTMIVSRKLERNFKGLEINPAYIKMAKDRADKELGPLF